mmetsp:Transcript_5236/g.23370  ORF Transcript_5236/g.23370 Transcript_5236/m.23370 type:complete len:218 (+) Transcript_5236:264-917(+)
MLRSGRDSIHRTSSPIRRSNCSTGSCATTPPAFAAVPMWSPTSPAYHHTPFASACSSRNALTHQSGKSASIASGCRPTSDAWNTRSRISAHVSFRMPSQPANARSAVVIARCRGEAMRTSGFGSRNLVTGASDAACAAPFFVRRVSYRSGSTKSEASHRFEARYSFISVRPCLTRCRIFPSSPSILNAADDDADEARGGGEERPPVTPRRWGGTYTL